MTTWPVTFVPYQLMIFLQLFASLFFIIFYLIYLFIYFFAQEWGEGVLKSPQPLPLRIWAKLSPVK